nr:Chain B, TarP-VBS1 [Chlamydia caviae]
LLEAARNTTTMLSKTLSKVC